MKPRHIISLVAFLLAGSSCLADQVQVEWQNPEDWRDFKNPSVRQDDAIRIYLPRLEEHLNKKAALCLPEGYQLKMVVEEIDLAGEYEPWRMPNWDEVRVVKGIYPPRMIFTWVLYDAEGNEVLSGEKRLIDMGFDFRTRSFNNDSLFYEKRMMTDWLYSLSRQIAKAAKEE